MNLCKDCKLNCLSGQRFSEAVRYTDQYDTSIMEGDQTAAARLAGMAHVELPADVAGPVEVCLDNRQLGLCVVAGVELVS